MTDLDQLKTQFDTVAKANRYPELSDAQWAILVDGASPEALDYLSRMATGALGQNASAVEMFKAWHKTVRITDRLRGLGFGDVTKKQVKTLLDAYGADRLVSAVQGIDDGNAAMRRQMTEWLVEVRAKLGPDAPAEAKATVSPQTVRSATSRFDPVPPPPGTHTSQVRSAAAAPAQPVRAGSPQRASTQAQGGNVAHLPTRAAREEASSHQRVTAPAAQSTTRTVAAAPQPEPRQYDEHTVYGKDVAVSFNCLPNRDRTANTVMLKVAKAKGGSCKSGMNWNDAILINLESHEVQTVTAVLMGLHDKVRYAGHGHDNQKWFEIGENTGEYSGSLRLKVGHGDDMRAVNIGANDIGQVTALFLRALVSQFKVAPQLIPPILKRAVEFYRANAVRQEARRGGQGNGQRRAG